MWFSRLAMASATRITSTVYHRRAAPMKNDLRLTSPPPPPPPIVSSEQHHARRQVERMYVHVFIHPCSISVDKRKSRPPQVFFANTKQGPTQDETHASLGSERALHFLSCLANVGCIVYTQWNVQKLATCMKLLSSLVAPCSIYINRKGFCVLCAI